MAMVPISISDYRQQYFWEEFISETPHDKETGQWSVSTRAPWDRTRQLHEVARTNTQEDINQKMGHLRAAAIAAVEVVKVAKSSFFVYVRGCLSGVPTTT